MNKTLKVKNKNITNLINSPKNKKNKCSMRFKILKYLSFVSLINLIMFKKNVDYFKDRRYPSQITYSFGDFL